MKNSRSCMRHHLVTVLDCTPSCILDKVITHSRQGFIFYVKRYHLDQLSNECTLRQCFVWSKQKTTPYLHDPDMSRRLITESSLLKWYGLCFIYTYHKPRHSRLCCIQSTGVMAAISSLGPSGLFQWCPRAPPFIQTPLMLWGWYA